MNIPESMAAIGITEPGGPEVLVPQELPVPAPGPGEVLIRVAAAGINYPDVMQRMGKYAPPPGHSERPGLEVSGEIAAVGGGVTSYRAGDPVVALCNGGGYAEYVVVPAGQVLPLPRGLRLIAGAAFPETFFTIQQTLVMRADLGHGMNVLIHGAAGGIGGAAIQITRLYGARPIAVVSSPEKAEYARALGASATINHSEEDFVARTMELTDGAGADRIVSIAGGEMLMRNMAAAAQYGAIIQLAGLSGSRSELDIGVLLRKCLTLIGSVLRPQSNETKAAIAESLGQNIWPAFAEGRLVKPRIRALRLEEASRAHVEMEKRGSFGKILLITRFGESVINDNSIARL